jgi:hypothetical protein
VLAIALLTACGEGGGGEPTRIPTPIPPTPTIRSTPLPLVSPAPALGETDARPIVLQIALFGEDPADSARRTGVDLQEALQNELDLEINVQFVDERTALEGLCSGAPTAAWVSAFTYVKAQTACGAEPVFAVMRGRPAATVGRTAEIIGRADIRDLSDLEGRVFCRSYEQDYFTSWVYPSLYLAAEGVDPAKGLAEIRDYPDDMSLGRALYQGDCAAAALPPDEFEDWLIDLSAFLSTESNPVTGRELEGWIHVVQPAADTVAPRTLPAEWAYDPGVIPYEVLVFPPTSALPLDLRESIIEAVAEFLDPDENSQGLNSLLDARGLIEVSPESYQDFSPVITRANWDMTFSG